MREEGQRKIEDKRKEGQRKIGANAEVCRRVGKKGVGRARSRSKVEVESWREEEKVKGRKKGRNVGVERKGVKT